MASFVILITGVNTWCSATPQPDGKSPPSILSFGKSVTAQMKGGETHSYRIVVQKDEFLHVIVGQLGIDVQVTVRKPDNTSASQMDSPNGDYGPEYVMFIAPNPDSYFIDIQALDP